MKLGIGEPKGLTISSDRQKGLDEALSRVYPEIEHRECMRHLYTNFKRKFRGQNLQHWLYTAALSYSPTQYATYVSRLKEANLDAYKFLQENHSKCWSMSQFGTTAKCDYTTNNLSESFNTWVAEARYRPILDLLNCIRQKIMENMESHRRKAREWTEPLVPTVMKYIRNASMVCTQMLLSNNSFFILIYY